MYTSVGYEFCDIIDSTSYPATATTMSSAISSDVLTSYMKMVCMCRFHHEYHCHYLYLTWLVIYKPRIGSIISSGELESWIWRTKQSNVWVTGVYLVG